MNKGFLVVILTLLLLNFVSCTSTQETANVKNTLDWAGQYTGTIPAADSGEGIEVKITLNTDGTYLVNYQYIGKGNHTYSSIGPFKWDDKKSLITLANKDLPRYYLVGKNTLTQLDTEGKVIKGTHADKYVLKKQ